MHSVSLAHFVTYKCPGIAESRKIGFYVNERCAIYRERDKTKLIFRKKFRWIRDKQPKHVNSKRRRKSARDTQRYRKRLRLRKMQDVLAKADKMILNKSSIQLDNHDKVLLCKG